MILSYELKKKQIFGFLSTADISCQKYETVLEGNVQHGDDTNKVI